MAKPVVDRIERELAGEVEVIRLNVLSAAGREAVLRYGIRGLPALLVLDGCGQVAETQVGFPQAGRLIDVARSLSDCTPSSDSGY